MDFAAVALLIAAGLAGGTIASLAGGAALITFPSLMAVGLTPVAAIATNIAALTPGSFTAALSDRSQLPPFDRGFVGLVFASVVGAGIGAVLLMLTPSRTFEILVPLLIGFATVLFAFGEQISNALRARSLAKHGREPEIKLTSIPMLLPVSVYGGYFAAGVGVLLVAVLQLATSGQYRPANATKNLVAALNGSVAMAVFAIDGSINWPAALSMMGGALIGSFIGARIARYAPKEIMRWVVTAIGVILTAVYAWRYWF
ncbi:sulfite exporter TauE/SafE family protein [Pseudorhodoplanes sp.]|uniref:sulfite exporter TauE/SafE family protein n=1 Tax=Pseudorhodoplanes sp. TaxID=1934341 RepID=UPI002B5DF963|nr:sulfite exporter TauE/SafE family protein [Pseudorhodoplanes sp.]HWV53678.1 sulfite exporter TauE/SafE family protein [Pseudorhodoplanes sp.]